MSNRAVIHAAQVVVGGDAGSYSPGYVAVCGPEIDSVGHLHDFLEQPGDDVVELSDATVIPGLIDSHCHLIGESDTAVTEDLVARSTLDGVLCARSVLQAGVTTVRDLGCKHTGIFALKRAVESGQFSGPRIFTAARNISGTGVPEEWRNYAYDGSDEIRRAVRREWQLGAHWAKLILSVGDRVYDDWRDVPLLAVSEIKTAIQEAHLKDMSVVCHVDGNRGAEFAMDGGLDSRDSIEHGVDLTEHSIDRMAERGIFFTPTAWFYSCVDDSPVVPFREELHWKTFQRALNAGVRIVAGSDADSRYCSLREALVCELKMMVTWGMSEKQALDAATVTGAELLGLERHLGSLTPGKLADLIAVDGDPLRDISSLSDVLLVMQEGQIVFNSRDSALCLKPLALTGLQPSRDQVTGSTS
jgi:imidazolonepropionase-like amidohydrolase